MEQPLEDGQAPRQVLVLVGVHFTPAPVFLVLADERIQVGLGLIQSQSNIVLAVLSSTEFVAVLAKDVVLLVRHVGVVG